MSTLAQYTFEPANVTLSGSTVTVVADQSSNGYNLANAGAPQYEQRSWLRGLPAVVFDGTDDTLKNTTGLANAMVGGIDKACQVYIVAQRTTKLAAAGQLWACGDNASANPFFRFLDNAATNCWEFRKRDAATGAGAGAGGTGSPCDNNPHVFKLKHDGTSCSIHVDGIQVFSGAMDVGDMGTLDNFALACLSRNTDSAFSAMRCWAFSAHDTLTAGEETALDSLYWDTYLAPLGLGGGDHFRRRV